MCLALGIVHPDKLDEQLTRLQFLEWIEYYKLRPFGHWIDTEMRAGLAARFSGQSVNECLPIVKELIESDSDEIDIESIPGGAAAQEFLRSLSKGSVEHGSIIGDHGS